MAAHSQLIVPAPAIEGAVIPGVTDSWNAIDTYLAGMPGVLHVVDPREIAAANKARGRCYAMGDRAQLTWTRGVTVTGGAGFNNRPTFDLVADNDLAIGPGTIKKSFSAIFPCNLASSVVSGTDAAYLLSTYTMLGTIDLECMWFGSGGKGLQLTPEVHAGNPNQLAVAKSVLDALSFSADTALVFGFSYDDATKSGVIWFQGATVPVATKSNFTTSPILDEKGYWSIGNIRYLSTNGWVGRFGQIPIFDRAYHLGNTIQRPGGDITDINLMQGLIDTVQAYYAIPG